MFNSVGGSCLQEGKSKVCDKLSRDLLRQSLTKKSYFTFLRKVASSKCAAYIIRVPFIAVGIRNNSKYGSRK